MLCAEKMDLRPFYRSMDKHLQKEIECMKYVTRIDLVRAV